MKLRNPTADKHKFLNMGQVVNGIRLCPLCEKEPRSRKKKALGNGGIVTLAEISKAFKAINQEKSRD